MLLKGLLRGEWGFDGMVLSDLGAIERLYSAHHVAATKKDAACLAIRSGVDMQFYDLPHDLFQRSLEECVKEGTLPMVELDRAAVACGARMGRPRGLWDPLTLSAEAPKWADLHW